MSRARRVARVTSLLVDLHATGMVAVSLRALVRCRGPWALGGDPRRWDGGGGWGAR